MDKEERLIKARERVIDSIAKNMSLYGVTPSIGRLYGLLFFQNEPMTLDEMKEALGMSKTSMSTSVRTLMDLKMVDKVWKKGSRKDQYVVEDDWYQTFIDYFSIQWRHATMINIQAIEKSKNEIEDILLSNDIDEQIKVVIEQDLNKLNKALQYYEWLNHLIDNLESHNIFEWIPKPD
ncbi:GbsR/MarR family transcriptional regulator [Bacillus sp. SM2101]|uniref:GbsR/MarR family transcriptional regulator n=1 Tax=Bacillus sp. SM2101 TaxID=2805366 RepID=UPI001BDE2E31|nr:GbsR/MarR family transcriptional regulator [Bacillus sp. SM2101]